jgi:hypothetical protein
MGGLLRIRTACVDRAFEGHPDAELIVGRVETSIAEVLSVARTIECGSRQERNAAVRRLIDIAGSETPDLIDAVTAAAMSAICEVAVDHGWSEEHTACVEDRAVHALTALERTLEELSPA